MSHREIEDIFAGGSIHRLFEIEPAYQKECTISQRGCDCFIFGYDESATLVDITRVSLVAHIDTRELELSVKLQKQSKMPMAAVGSLVFQDPCSSSSSSSINTSRDKTEKPSVTLVVGASNSPWVA